MIQHVQIRPSIHDPYISFKRVVNSPQINFLGILKCIGGYVLAGEISGCSLSDVRQIFDLKNITWDTQRRVFNSEDVPVEFSDWVNFCWAMTAAGWEIVQQAF